MVPADDLAAAVDELAAVVASKPRYAVQATTRHVHAVTEGPSQASRSWSDADGLLAGLRDPEGRASAVAYLERVRGRRR